MNRFGFGDAIQRRWIPDRFGLWVLGGTAVFAALMGYLGTIHQFDYADEFLIILLPPIFFSAFRHEHRAYLGYTLWSAGLSFWVLSAVSPQFKSLVTMAIVVAMLLLSCELIHSASRRLRIEQRFRNQLMDGSPHAILAVSAGRGIVYVNRAFERLTRYGKDEVTGLKPPYPWWTVRSIFNPEESHANGARCPKEKLFRRKTGELFWVQSNATRIRDPQHGELFVVNWVDITKVKRAESALLASEERFRTLFESVPAVAIQGYGPDGTVFFWNKANQEVYGYAAEEAVGKNLVDLIIPPPMRAQVRRVLLNAGRTGAMPESGELTLMRKDGSFVPVHSSHVAIRVQNRLELYCLDIDLTPIKRAEAARRASEEKYRDYLEYSPMGILIADSEGTFTEVNLSLCRLLGYGREELLSLSPEELDSPGEGELFSGYLGDLRRRGCRDGRGTLRKKDGTALHAEFRGAVLTNGQSIVYASDLTERKNLEEQLLHSQKMEAIGTLAGGIAHDFNNILTSILGYSQLAIDRLGPDHPCHRDLDQVRQSGERASSLTRQLLAFGRKQLIQPRPLDINSILLEMGGMLERVLGDDIEVATSLAPGLGPILADPCQIDQIILNIAVNARDAMPRGGRFTISTGEVEIPKTAETNGADPEPGPYVSVSFRDTGSGIPVEIRDKVFEPFFTTKDVDKGTGLGLSTVYGIVKQNGGHITLESREGAGTCFTILLPRRNGDNGEPPAPRRNRAETHDRPGAQLLLR